MPKPTVKPPAMLPGELQRHLVRLGLSIPQAAWALGISHEHMRALADGRSRVREKVAGVIRTMTLADASEARLAWWDENQHARPWSVPINSKRRSEAEEVSKDRDTSV